VRTRSATLSGRTQHTANGIKVIACENTVCGQKLTRDDMLPTLSYVSAGVTESMTRKSQG